MRSEAPSAVALYLLGMGIDYKLVLQVTAKLGTTRARPPGLTRRAVKFGTLNRAVTAGPTRTRILTGGCVSSGP